MAHNHLHRAHARQDDSDVVVSVVYVTASKTFEGEIGGYSTVGVPVKTPEAPPAIPTPEPTPTPEPPRTSPTSTPRPKTTPYSPVDSEDDSLPPTIRPTSKPNTLATSPLPTEISPPRSGVGTSLPIVAASGGIPTRSISSAASSSPTSASSASGASDGGLTSGAQVGVAVGVLLLICAALSIILVCFKKRKNAAQAEAARENEKHNPPIGRAASVQTAPRLSLRPITQFLPNLAEKRASRGNPLVTHLAPVAESREARIARERPMTAPSNASENPFGNHAEAVPAENPFENHANIDPVNASGPPIVVMPTPGASAVVAPVGLKRGASKRENGPAPMDFTTSGPLKSPPSPAGTEFSLSSQGPGTPVQTSSGAAIAAAGGPVNSAVHRVQLDFTPSMEDELELKQGQLIRVLHEYDDGWALCIRLDRSRQGVVPRTCLSTRPVKPRPMQNGPRGPPLAGMRGPQQQSPMSPAMNGQRMAPNALHIRPSTPNGQYPRPASPAGSMQQRQPGPMVHGQDQGRARSNSDAQMQRPRMAPGPSQMTPSPQFDGAGSPPQRPSPLGSPPQGFIGRKPVPGQAL